MTISVSKTLSSHIITFMLQVSEIREKNVWDNFFSQNGSPSFLHSWEWGEFQKEQGQDILRLGLYEGKELTAIALVEKIKARRGNFLFIPHGPIFQLTINNYQLSILISQFLHFLISFAHKEEFSFIRIAPSLEKTEENIKIFADLNFRTAQIYIHSENFWVLDLGKNEEELLANMRKTTRYLIRKAVKDGVIIEKRGDSQAVEKFQKIYEETVKREKFSGYSDTYIKKEFESFNKSGDALILLGKVKNSDFNQFQPISTNFNYLAGALLLFTNSGAFYHQGASIHTKIPVPYLLHWEGIKEAKKRGCKFYNFWGVIQPGRTPRNWGGLTLFKQGFGGYQIDFVPTQDFIISPKYYLTYLYEKYLGWRRGV